MSRESQALRQALCQTRVSLSSPRRQELPPYTCRRMGTLSLHPRRCGRASPALRGRSEVTSGPRELTSPAPPRQTLPVRTRCPAPPPRTRPAGVPWRVCTCALEGAGLCTPPAPLIPAASRAWGTLSLPLSFRRVARLALPPPRASAGRPDEGRGDLGTSEAETGRKRGGNPPPLPDRAAQIPVSSVASLQVLSGVCPFFQVVTLTGITFMSFFRVY